MTKIFKALSWRAKFKIQDAKFWLRRRLSSHRVNATYWAEMVADYKRYEPEAFRYGGFTAKINDRGWLILDDNKKELPPQLARDLGKWLLEQFE